MSRLKLLRLLTTNTGEARLKRRQLRETTYFQAI